MNRLILISTLLDRVLDVNPNITDKDKLLHLQKEKYFMISDALKYELIKIQSPHRFNDGVTKTYLCLLLDESIKEECLNYNEFLKVYQSEHEAINNDLLDDIKKILN